MTRPRRSVLYMPGSNGRAMEKAQSLPADAVILDLEDAVAPDAKEMARAQVCEVVKAKCFGGREVVIRVNGLTSQWGAADLAAAAEAEPDAILLPKISSPSDLAEAAEHLTGTKSANTALWAMMETPLAILDAGAIAGAGGRLACLVMGTNDLVKEFRGRHTQDRQNLSAALGISVAAARAYGLGIIDGVYNDIADADGFLDSCKQARAYGFDGKTLIHPSQLAPCNDVFAPSPAEVDAARKIIAAFDLPENRGKGAIALDGHMVERLHAEIARQTVALADAIAALA
ncbi:MAG TPA: CoA ester lyase [Rhizomicrobium sp.]|jgi:citrate lyase subunit beta/citryl-CoA lyase|nr:CoA ester lyase [Rhizomicrobium sp.]